MAANGLAGRVTILAGDNRCTAPKGVADRVMLGLIPSSEAAWPAALAALRPASGGWLHVHANVTDSDEGRWVAATVAELQRLAAAAGVPLACRAARLERVKWYAPHVRHVVLDVEARPPGAPFATPPDAPLRPAKPPRPAAAPKPAPTAAAAPAAAPAAGAAPTAPPPLPPYPTARSACVADAPHVPILTGPMPAARFAAEVAPRRAPVLLRGLDLGPAGRGAWTAQRLAAVPGPGAATVSAHVTRDPRGALDFVRKNYVFRNMSLRELALRAAGLPPPPGEGGGGAAWPPLTEGGEGPERLYLRSVGANPRKARARARRWRRRLAVRRACPSLTPPPAARRSPPAACASRPPLCARARRSPAAWRPASRSWRRRWRCPSL